MQVQSQLPLIVIVGPTASGKTALSLELAKKFGGEIICADSRTVYRGMDIGTAKPTRTEQAEVPHWGLDLVEPGDSFSAADFKRYANQEIDEIRNRAAIPFLVGGTGLYVDAVVFDYDLNSKADPELRKQLDKLSLSELHDYCDKHNIDLPENSANKRYVMRAIERKGLLASRRQKPIDTTIIVGVSTSKEVLLSRIRARAEHIFNDNVVEEAISLGKKYGWDSEAMTGNVYRVIRLYVEGKMSRQEAIDKFTTLDWRLAKRQLTWLRRNSYIRWLTAEEATVYLGAVLAGE